MRAQGFVVPRSENMLVIAPHQDDESLACGGMIRSVLEAGGRVDVVFLTDGRKGDRGLECSPGDGLASLRRSEALAALEILGVAIERTHFLNFEDGELPGLPVDSVLHQQICQLINSTMPSFVLLPFRYDCHPDHEAAYKITRHALEATRSSPRLLEYLVWAPWLSPLRTLRFGRSLGKMLRVDIRSVLEIKRRAIFAHTSQVLSLPIGFLDRFLLPDELFFAG